MLNLPVVFSINCGILKFCLLIDNVSFVQYDSHVLILHYLLFLFCRYAIVRDMTAAGLGLNKFCYAALILAHKNKSPRANDTSAKVKISNTYRTFFIEVDACY